MAKVTIELRELRLGLQDVALTTGSNDGRKIWGAASEEWIDGPLATWRLGVSRRASPGDGEPD
jgi:hypothetical protein